jgi:hypothetical protein
MDWIDLVQDTYQWSTLVNTVINLRVPQNVEKFLSSCTIGDFSRRAQLREVSQLEATAFTMKECCFLQYPFRQFFSMAFKENSIIFSGTLIQRHLLRIMYRRE